MTKKHLIILIFMTIIVGTVGIVPLVISPTNPFYNIDPETAFIANSIELLESGRMNYYGHPGTPVIVQLASLYSAIKIPVEIFGDDFIQWSLEHYRSLFWISRGYFFLLFIIGYFIIHIGVYKRFQSLRANIFLFVIFFLDPSFQEIATKVASEPLAILLFALWLIAFIEFEKNEKNSALLFMAFISGLLVADKLIYLPIAVSSISIAVFRRQADFQLKGKALLTSFALFGAGFFSATLPIVNNYPKLATWLFNILTKSGIYGTGGSGIIDFKLFSQAALYWLNDRVGMLALFVFVLSGMIRIKSSVPFKVIMIVLTGSLFYFMRYPAPRYQEGNILLLYVSAIYIFSKLSKQKQVLFLLLFSVPALFYARKDFLYKRTLILRAANLQKFIDSLPTDEDIVWEYAEAEEFALIRARNDTGYFISPQVRLIKPHMWELVSQTFTDIRNNSDKTFPMSCECWDGIVVQERSYKYFMAKQQNKSLFSKVSIPDTEMLYLVRNKL